MTFPYLFDVKMLIVANIFKIFIIIMSFDMALKIKYYGHLIFVIVILHAYQFVPYKI